MRVAATTSISTSNVRMRRSAMSITAIAITNGNRTTTATMCAVMTAYPIHGVDAVQENECRKHHGRHASDAHRLIRHSGGSIGRSEEHTSELQSLMRISYAVLCLKKINMADAHSDNN